MNDMVSDDDELYHLITSMPRLLAEPTIDLQTLSSDTPANEGS